MDMYPDNVYIQNHEEIVQICENMHKGMLVAFVVFDKRHGLDITTWHRRSISTGARWRPARTAC